MLYAVWRVAEVSGSTNCGSRVNVLEAHSQTQAKSQGKAPHLCFKHIYTIKTKYMVCIKQHALHNQSHSIMAWMLMLMTCSRTDLMQMVASQPMTGLDRIADNAIWQKQERTCICNMAAKFKQTHSKQGIPP